MTFIEFSNFVGVHGLSLLMFGRGMRSFILLMEVYPEFHIMYYKGFYTQVVAFSVCVYVHGSSVVLLLTRLFFGFHFILKDR